MIDSLELLYNIMYEECSGNLVGSMWKHAIIIFYFLLSPPLLPSLPAEGLNISLSFLIRKL